MVWYQSARGRCRRVCEVTCFSTKRRWITSCLAFISDSIWPPEGTKILLHSQPECTKSFIHSQREDTWVLHSQRGSAKSVLYSQAGGAKTVLPHERGTRQISSTSTSSRSKTGQHPGESRDALRQTAGNDVMRVWLRQRKWRWCHRASSHSAASQVEHWASEESRYHGQGNRHSCLHRHVLRTRGKIQDFWVIISHSSLSFYLLVACCLRVFYI